MIKFEKKSRKNFQVTAKEDGKKYWISRSVAVHGIILLVNRKTSQAYVLVEKRGPACPDEIGKYSNVCGYLDWDETLIDALKRETYEETGLKLDDLKYVDIKQTGIDDEFNGGNAVKQNITIRYMVTLDLDEVMSKFDSGEINCDTASRGGEEDEVSEIRIIPVTDRNPVDESQFAFNHGKLINEIIEKHDSRRNWF